MTASTNTNTDTATRATPLTSAARISVRWKPNVRRPRAGRAASAAANSASPIAPTSDRTCPASANSATEWNTIAPTTAAATRREVDRKRNSHARPVGFTPVHVGVPRVAMRVRMGMMHSCLLPGREAYAFVRAREARGGARWPARPRCPFGRVLPRMAVPLPGSHPHPAVRPARLRAVGLPAGADPLLRAVRDTCCTAASRARRSAARVRWTCVAMRCAGRRASCPPTTWRCSARSHCSGAPRARLACGCRTGSDLALFAVFAQNYSSTRSSPSTRSPGRSASRCSSTRCCRCWARWDIAGARDARGGRPCWWAA